MPRAADPGGPDASTARPGTGADVGAVEARLRALLEPYRATLETFDLYGVDTLRMPGARPHDWFAGIRRASRHVGLFLLPMASHPELLEGCSSGLLRLRTGKSVFNVRTVDESILAELEALLARAHLAYLANHPAR